MKKFVAMVMVLAMMLALGTTAFAAGRGLTVEEAKKAALNYAGVKASEATFTKVHRDWDDGREVYEVEFYANGTEYEMDVDVLTGAVTDFSTEYHGAYSGQPGGYYDDDRYDHDWDDPYDDWDDRFDHDFDLFDLD